MYTINDMPPPLDPRIVEALSQVETATVIHSLQLRQTDTALRMPVARQTSQWLAAP